MTIQLILWGKKCKVGGFFLLYSPATARKYNEAIGYKSMC